MAAYPHAVGAKIREVTVAARMPVPPAAVTSVVHNAVDGSRSRLFP
jgi:hypothetical protein